MSSVSREVREAVMGTKLNIVAEPKGTSLALGSPTRCFPDNDWREPLVECRMCRGHYLWRLAYEAQGKNP